MFLHKAPLLLAMMASALTVAACGSTDGTGGNGTGAFTDASNTDGTLNADGTAGDDATTANDTTAGTDAAIGVEVRRPVAAFSVLPCVQCHEGDLRRHKPITQDVEQGEILQRIRADLGFGALRRLPFRDGNQFRGDFG